MTTEHTPSWKVVERPGKKIGFSGFTPVYEIRDRAGTLIADVQPASVAHPADANARLIVASPTLYAYVAMRASLGDTEANTLLQEAELAESNQPEGAVS